jgi:hypothetical protein
MTAIFGGMIALAAYSLFGTKRSEYLAPSEGYRAAQAGRLPLLWDTDCPADEGPMRALRHYDSADSLS